MKIKVLSEDTINKIAAGEVVERPASVVKELVENSLDAGGTQIDIEVNAGGKNLIRVADNGCGMEKDDAVLAFERHATSKINSADDLFRIDTLGFRGEALPSIAGVSRTELITRTSETESAIRIKIEGGKLLEVKEEGAPYGTMVSVKNLFYNTPARRKFLKSTNTELTHIINTISNYSLVYSKCGFKLIHNEETVIEIFPKDTLKDRIAVLYGKETSDKIVELNNEKEGIRITGYAGTPVFTHPNRTLQLAFVNKRPISSRAISYAIYEAYGNLIPKGRYPVVFLFIEIHPESIDVNVHPTKKEIRFGDDRIIKDIIRETIWNALNVRESVSAGINSSMQTTADKGFGYMPLHSLPASWNMREETLLTEKSEGRNVLQVLDAYIIAESEDGLEILDQHAVHERILYEKIKSVMTSGYQDSQRLLIPINIELSIVEAKMLKDEIPLFKELGFSIEDFGNSTFIIDAIPPVMDKADISEFIKDVLNEIKETKGFSIGGHIKDGIIKLMACRAAVKQGDKLDNMEIRKLINDWINLKFPYTCPHGRPAVFKMTRDELDKKFQRKMSPKGTF